MRRTPSPISESPFELACFEGRAFYGEILCRIKCKGKRQEK